MVVPEIVSGAFATACDLGDVLEVRIPKGGFVSWEDFGPRLALDAVQDRPANPDTAHGSQ